MELSLWWGSMALLGETALTQNPLDSFLLLTRSMSTQYDFYCRDAYPYCLELQNASNCTGPPVNPCDWWKLVVHRLNFKRLFFISYVSLSGKKKQINVLLLYSGRVRQEGNPCEIVFCWECIRWILLLEWAAVLDPKAIASLHRLEIWSISISRIIFL